MIAKNILLRARLSTLLLVIGSALFLASPTFADEAVSVPANTVDFQAPVEDAPLAVAATSIADLGITPLTDAQIEEILNEHNMYRARHQAPALEWDAFLARDAERALGNCRPFSSRSRVCIYRFFFGCSFSSSTLVCLLLTFFFFFYLDVKKKSQ